MKEESDHSLIMNHRTVLQGREKVKNEETNRMRKRYLLHMRKQAKGESFDNFYKNIQFLFESCSFTDDSVLRDHVVFGIKDTGVREQLLEYDDPSLEIIIEICRSGESKSCSSEMCDVNRETRLRRLIGNESDELTKLGIYDPRDESAVFMEMPFGDLVKEEPEDFGNLTAEAAVYESDLASDAPPEEDTTVKSKLHRTSSTFRKRLKKKRVTKKKNKTKHVYKCKVCSKILSSYGSLYTHTFIHTGEKRHKCEICHRAFAIAGSLRKHMAIHTDDKPFVCPICNRAFKLKSTMRSHVATHVSKENVELKKQRQVDRMKLLNELKKKHNIIPKGPIVCSICHKNYSSKEALRNHKVVHTGERKHQCHICSKLFTQRGSLSIHLSTHAEVKAHRCDACNKGFATREYLRKHNLIHTGEMPYSCDQCGKRFRVKSNLNYHILMHKNERIYECEVCQKSYATKSNLKKHMNYHTRPHKCEICSKGFATTNAIKKHMRAHLK